MYNIDILVKCTKRTEQEDNDPIYSDCIEVITVNMDWLQIAVDRDKPTLGAFSVLYNYFVEHGAAVTLDTFQIDFINKVLEAVHEQLEEYFVKVLLVNLNYIYYSYIRVIQPIYSKAETRIEMTREGKFMTWLLELEFNVLNG